MQTFASMFRTLADPARLRILALLGRSGELCVCDIEEILGFTQTKTSRHLAYLRRTGLVRVRRRHLWKHYSLVPLEQEPTGRFLDLALALIEKDPAIVRDRNRLARRLRSASCAACPPPAQDHPRLENTTPKGVHA